MKKILIAFLGIYFVLLIFNTNSVPLFVADENIYSRSIVSLMHGSVDNNNHPLLAKEITLVLVLISEALTGKYMPIFWRIGSIFASLGCLIFFYKICRIMFNQKISLFATIILAIDPMYFSFSRILNLDIVALCFSMASLYFLLRSIQNVKKKYIYISALLTGLSLAAKFSLVFVLPLIPIIYFIILQNYRENLKVCLVSYTLIFSGLVLGNSVFFFFSPKISFFKYLISIVQANLHLYSSGRFQVSPVYTWFTIPQIMLLWRIISGNFVTTVAIFQNPIFFVLAIPSVLITSYLLLRQKINNPKFISIILIFFLANYLPWLGNIRSTFYYYIIPLIPLIIILVINLISFLPSKVSKKVFLVLSIFSMLIFILYFPILAGIKIPLSYEKVLFILRIYKYPETKSIFCQLCYLLTPGASV